MAIKYGKFPARPKKPEPTPAGVFGVIEVDIGGTVMPARPFEFENDKKGNPIRALKFSTSCPKCGHGIVIDVNLGGDVACANCGVGVKQPMLNPLAHTPQSAKPKVKEAEPEAELQPAFDDPFCNPLQVGLVKLTELDPSLAAKELLNVGPTSASVAPSVLDLGAEEEVVP